METEAIIVSAITAAGFLAIGLVLAIMGRRLRWPDGERYNHVTKRDGKKFRVQIISSPDTGYLDLDTRRAIIGAVVSVYRAWRDRFPESADKVHGDMKHIAVHLLTDHEFDRLDGTDTWMDEVNGTVGSVGRMLGSGIHRIVVRGKRADHIKDDGDIVIHEAMHVANRASGTNVWSDAGHKREDVWGRGNDSVESLAFEKFEPASRWG